jgi:FeS assembly SUF system regulator
MIRLSKLADYGIVLLAYFTGEHRGPDGVIGVWTTRELAEASHLPLPTVAKVMKGLCRNGLVLSQRGVHGGYRLARPAAAISVVDMIAALEGPISMTACSLVTPSNCELEAACPVRSNWQRINQVVVRALADLTLADMQLPMPAPKAAFSHDVPPSVRAERPTTGHLAAAQRTLP